MNWRDVCDNQLLQNLPFKVELNEWGQIVMSPASNRHGRNQMAIGVHLRGLVQGGDIIAECSVDTSKGVKVADVAWASDEFLQSHGFETPYTAAPEICVEVVSPSNSTEEIAQKRALYFERGAREVWLCQERGAMSFFGPQGQLERSVLVPGFPATV